MGPTQPRLPPGRQIQGGQVKLFEGITPVYRYPEFFITLLGALGQQRFLALVNQRSTFELGIRETAFRCGLSPALV